MINRLLNPQAFFTLLMTLMLARFLGLLGFLSLSLGVSLCPFGSLRLSLCLLGLLSMSLRFLRLCSFGPRLVRLRNPSLRPLGRLGRGLGLGLLRLLLLLPTMFSLRAFHNTSLATSANIDVTWNHGVVAPDVGVANKGMTVSWLIVGSKCCGEEKRKSDEDELHFEEND